MLNEKNRMNYNKKEEEQINIINKAISELVYEKTQMIKAYNYYHGKRDPEQFRHLEENLWYRYSNFCWICPSLLENILMC